MADDRRLPEAERNGVCDESLAFHKTIRTSAPPRELLSNVIDPA